MFEKLVPVQLGWDRGNVKEVRENIIAYACILGGMQIKLDELSYDPLLLYTELAHFGPSKNMDVSAAFGSSSEAAILTLEDIC
ncbi:hypothetical protein KY284_025315 [Solanum tuberosum]|nr:hypothetical protein KY284_025315 [Solanum tuberosum]